MHQITFIAKVLESRNDANWGFNKSVKLIKKDVKVEFVPCYGMLIDAYDMQFEVNKVVANLETGKVSFSAEATKKFVWYPNMKEPTPSNSVIKKLQDAGFSKEEK